MDRTSKERLHQVYNYYERNGLERTAVKFDISQESVNRYIRQVRRLHPELYNRPSRPARILLLDIENAPNVVHTWGLWNQNIAINQIMQPWYILSWAAKWLGEDDVFWDALCKHPRAYKNDPTDDKLICESMLDILNQADIIITHNGINHDIPKLKSQFIKHDLKPYSPVKHIDTCKSARGMGFTSKKLQFIAQHLGIGQKLAHQGHQLWVDCMKPQIDKEAWNVMIEYNCVDINLLEGVYLKLRPWIYNHPNVNLYSKQKDIRCTKCGGTVTPDGEATTPANVYQAYRCNECGAWSRSRYQKLSKEERETIAANYL